MEEFIVKDNVDGEVNLGGKKIKGWAIWRVRVNKRVMFLAWLG